MSEQEENERICEWLGWKRHYRTRSGHQFWSDGSKTDDGNYLLLNAPTFSTGNDMHFMLHRLQTLPAEETLEVRRHLADCLLRNRFSPYQVRAAVLAHIGGKS